MSPKGRGTLLLLLCSSAFECPWLTGNSTAPIHTLDDDSILQIFFLYRPAILAGDEDDHDFIFGGRGWDREGWWYKLAHVCQRWRKLILGSASHLGLCLVCTHGTPVAEMLAHSPHLPLVIDYIDEHQNLRAGDEEEISLALEQRSYVSRVRFRMPVPNLQQLISAMEEEYPVLEYLIMGCWTRDASTTLILPQTFQAPHLRHLVLSGFTLPIGSRLLTTAVGLVTLCLYMNRPSEYFQPNTLLRWISFLPQLETLMVVFLFPVPNRDVERQLMHTPITTHITLPNLRWFGFQGISAYLETLVRRITAPRLERLIILFFKQLTFSVPRLLQFINTTENIRFDSAKFKFSREQVDVNFYSQEEAEKHPLSVSIHCWHLDWQVSSVGQIFSSLGQIPSTVEHLTLQHWVHSKSSEGHNEVDRTEWHKLFEPFNNVKTLRVGDGLVGALSLCLRLDDGELPLELLPELQELTYSGKDDAGDAFKSFVDARQDAGRPVTLRRD